MHPALQLFKSKPSSSESFSHTEPQYHPHLFPQSRLCCSQCLHLRRKSMMGSRAKLLKPHSWGAADICLFSTSPPSIVLYPHFMVLILSACLRTAGFCTSPHSCTGPPGCFSPSHPLSVFLSSSNSGTSSFFLFLFFLFRVKPAGCLGPCAALQRAFV